MCGIFGGISKSNIVPRVLDGLRSLEYRGYDSVGIAGINSENNLIIQKVVGRVAELRQVCELSEFASNTLIGHTRWATHGRVNIENTHPHISNDNKTALVHNGVIENHEELRQELITKGINFVSETDSEVIVHLIAYYYSLSSDFIQAIRAALKRLHGAYSLAILSSDYPDQIICTKLSSPLVLGVLNEQMLFSSDVTALSQSTNKVVYLEDGDLAIIKANSYVILDNTNQEVIRAINQISHTATNSDLGEFKHYMQKEIFQQGEILQNIVKGFNNKFNPEYFGVDALNIFKSINQVQIIACGTSYNASLVAKYWIEQIAKIQCNVDIASEYCYRRAVVNANALTITISQSGETADTIAALKYAIDHGAKYTLAISSVGSSSTMRLSLLNLLVDSGLEIGVAATKSFTSQLVWLLYLSCTLAKVHNIFMGSNDEKYYLDQLNMLPDLVTKSLKSTDLEQQIKRVAYQLSSKNNAIYLGRDSLYPIAIEGALKLKEISYMHVEAYAAGELKHGPLALIDKDLPIVTTIACNLLVDKVKANIQVVLARGGMVFTIVDNLSSLDQSIIDALAGVIDLSLDTTIIDASILPILYVIPLQLLAYHVAIYKGTDIDKPRNLAKSVTVE